MTQKTILLVEDEPVTQQLMRNLLSKKLGYKVLTADNGKQALLMLNQHNYDTFSAILLDIDMPHMNGLEVLEYTRKRYGHIPVIMLTGDTNPQTVVKATKLGAYDYINKPVDAAHLEVVLHNAIRMYEMSQELSRIKRNQQGQLGFKDLVGYQSGLASVVHIGLKAATTEAPVMITGETGTGKELFARAIHGESSRAGKPFIAINCGAIPEKLVESILFGHEKGAFTGATEKTLGKFREAEGGTIFLDELGELPLAAQVKLLRVLQEQEVEPVGSAKPVKVDVRIISATNRKLEEEVKAGHLREDLFFRLNVLPIRIPSLAERGEDIILLAEYFLQQAALQDTTLLKTLSADAKHYLVNRPWPGNIRELANLMRRLNIWCESDEVTVEILKELDNDAVDIRPNQLTHNVPSSRNVLSLYTTDDNYKTMQQIEAEVMQTVLALEGNNITHAAEKLGIAKSTFYRKMKQLKAN